MRKLTRLLLLATVIVAVSVGAGYAAFQAGEYHFVGDVKTYNNDPNSDYGTAIAEEPTIRMDASTGLIDYGAGDSTATSVSAGFVAANRFGIGASDCYSLEGATANAFELSLCATDPTADNTATLPIMSAANYAIVGSTLVTNSAHIANSVWMASNGVVFEGVTADDFETTVSPTDVGADVAATIPGGGDAAFAFMASALTSNDVDIANSVWGVSNGLHFEGSTANDFETIVTTADVAQDVTWTHRDVTSGAAQYGDVPVSYSFGQVIADHLSTIVMVADRAYVLEGVNASWQVAESTGDFDIMIQKLVGVTACGSGTDMLSAAIDTSSNGGGGTADTTTAGALHATPANLAIAVGDTLCIQMVTGTPNEIKGLLITLALAVD